MKQQTANSDNIQDQTKNTLTEPLWTVQDVSNYLRLEQETVRMMARAKKIPAIKVGKVWRFKVGDIKEMLKNG